MTKRKYTAACLGGAAMGVVLAAAPAVAQEQNSAQGDVQQQGAGLEDIVVTARKSSESLISVPVAVSAISSESLARSGATNLSQIAQLAPQVQMFSGTTGATFSVRGLGSSQLDQGLEQTVSVNIDGVQVGRGRIINAAFFDIGQIEVLKGPQALFFGKNSPAGVVSITSKGPGDKLEGFVKAGYEFNARERYLEAAVGGPISDTLGIRIAGRGSKMSGYLVNNASAQPWFWNPAFTNPGAAYHREPRSEDINGRLTAVWKPSSDFSMTLKVAGGTHKDSGTHGNIQLICPGGVHPIVVGPGAIQPGFPPVGIPDVDSDCSANGQTSLGSIPIEIASTIPGYKNGKPYTDQTTLVSSLTMKYDTGNVSLTSVTGYYRIDSKGTLLPTYDGLGVVSAFVAEKNNTFTQEIRAVTKFDMPLNFTAGGYFESVDSSINVNSLLFFAGFDRGSAATTQSQASNSYQTYSLFGQARWSIQENLELAGGLRWTHERKRTDNVNNFLHFAAAASGGFVPEGVTIPVAFSDNNVSPEVTLTWHPVQDMTLYAAYKTGYKSGGISNPTLLTASYNANSLRFDSEKAKGFEVGAKGFLLDRSLRLGLTAYRYDYDNLQVSSFDTATLSFIIQNAASARIQGMEAEAQWKVLPVLTLQGAVGYNDAKYRSYSNAPCGNLQAAPCNASRIQDLSGRTLARAPNWSGNLGAVLDVPLGAGLRLGLNGDMNFSSSYFTQENLDPLAKQGAFTRFNAGARVYSEDDRWELALIGRNLTNKYVISFTTDTVYGPAGNFAAGTYRPREINLQGTFRF